MMLKTLFMMSQFVVGVLTMRCQNATGGTCNQIRPCGQYGGSCGIYCSDGCEFISGGFSPQRLCVNSTNSFPNFTVQNPNDCRLIANVAETDQRCNMNGTGIVCPYGCALNNDKCVPIGNLPFGNVTCESEKRMLCPRNCYYDEKMHKCFPTDPNSVCEFIERNILCPSGCTYNNDFKKCISPDPNIVCEMTLGTYCPNFSRSPRCKLNMRGDTCIGINGYDICERMFSPVCPRDCKYNTSSQICVDDGTGRTNLPKICEPVLSVICPFGQYANISLRIPSCVRSFAAEISDICSDNGVIRYPSRLREKYSYIMCKYSDIYCDQSGRCRQRNPRGTSDVCPTYSQTCCQF